MDVGKKRKTMLATSAHLIILLQTVNSAGFITLQALENQMIKCNEKAVLQCNISSSKPFDILNMKWGKHDDNFECDPTSNSNSPAFECNYTTEALTLTFLHPKPADAGIYFCMIKANTGHDSKKMNVSIEGGCTGEFFPMPAEKNFQCTFTGVYPAGTIHWFHNDVNVTLNSTVTSLTNTDGTFNITSVLHLPHKPHAYNCSLWSLKNRQYIESQQLAVRSRVKGLQCSVWTLFIIGLMLRHFLLT